MDKNGNFRSSRLIFNFFCGCLSAISPPPNKYAPLILLFTFSSAGLGASFGLSNRLPFLPRLQFFRQRITKRPCGWLRLPKLSLSLLYCASSHISTNRNYVFVSIKCGQTSKNHKDTEKRLINNKIPWAYNNEQLTGTLYQLAVSDLVRTKGLEPPRFPARA